MIHIPKVELIQKFVDSYYRTKKAIDADDAEGAAAAYRNMHSVYSEIANSDLDMVHKQLAHDQMTKVYKALSAANKQPASHATTHIVAAAILLLLFSFLVFFRPAFTGMATAQEITQDLNIAFVESGTRTIQLTAMPSSLSISGKMDGKGTARVFADSQVVFDSETARLADDGSFSHVCEKTCIAKGLGRDIKLDVELDNAALTIYSVEYATARPNTAPKYNGPKVFEIKGASTIDLSTFFFDPDGDALAFLATSTKDLGTRVIGNKLTITPQEGLHGERTITLIASDEKELAKVDITIVF